MAKCKTCGAEFQGESDYCDKCMKESQDHTSESYLDSLLKSVVSQPNTNHQAFQKKKETLDSNDTIALVEDHDIDSMEEYNEKEDILALNEENILALDEHNDLNEEDILALDESNDHNDEDIIALDDNDDLSGEDIIALNDNNDLNDDDILTSEEDNNEINEDTILALEEDNQPLEEDSYIKEQNVLDEKNDFDSDFNNDADDDLVALLGMITGLEDSERDSSMDEDIHDDNTQNLEEVFSIDSYNTDDSSQMKEDKNPDHLGEVFSDSLSAIDVLKDLSVNADGLDESKSDVSQSQDREEVKKKKKELIFGSQEKNDEAEAEEEPKKKGKTKKSKRNKKSKVKNKAVTNKDSSDEEELTNKESAKDKRAKKASNKKNSKAKKENVKKKPSKKINSIVAEMEEDTGKISKVGTSIALIFCGLVASLIIVGTNLYTYSLNIRKAETDFARKRYMDAYKEIYGYQVRKNDEDLYNKIMTVMYVNKQLNSYYNYSGLNKQPEALDSLLKGLARYEEHIDTAIALGIKDDLDGIRTQIVKELKDNYNIKESEAVAIIYTEDKEEYEQFILNAAEQNSN